MSRDYFYQPTNCNDIVSRKHLLIRRINEMKQNHPKEEVMNNENQYARASNRVTRRMGCESQRTAQEGGGKPLFSGWHELK